MFAGVCLRFARVIGVCSGLQVVAGFHRNYRCLRVFVGVCRCLLGLQDMLGFAGVCSYL